MQGWGRNCETNAPAVVPRRGRWGISLIGALTMRLTDEDSNNQGQVHGIT